MRDPAAIRKILTDRTHNPGDIISIDPPLAVLFNCPDAHPDIKQPITFETNSKSQKRQLTVKIFPILGARAKEQLQVISPGYVCSLSGTTYAYQGKTMPKSIVNLNKCNTVALNMGHINVGISRVINHLDLRIMPWKIGGESSKQHLRELRHPDEYLIWNGSYDSSGNFNEDYMIQAKRNLPPPINPTLLSTQRPTRTHPTIQLSTTTVTTTNNNTNNHNTQITESLSTTSTSTHTSQVQHNTRNNQINEIKTT